MTTSKNSSVLKDVLAYVDVWSSDKTANYSKPFVQQLQEMGAQVSKTFNKQVTHVVFNNGHPATWRKAKNSDVRLVSVLWVGRCHDDGVHVDEKLYPALNDESNPVLKNKKHRCMQPKDSPERTPENDRRMRKKLDKMMKDFAPSQPLVTDVSPIIIDEDNGIVYSPALKRSDYMAQRLKDMREKRENLSPTASQMIESCSPTGLKPSLDDHSDDDSCASVAEPGYSPQEEGRTQVDHLEEKKSSEKPWLSPCHDVSERISSPLKCLDFTDKGGEEGNKQHQSRRTSVSKRMAEKDTFSSLLEIPCQDKRSGVSKRRCGKSSSLSPNKHKRGKQALDTATSFTETKIYVCSDAVKSSSVLSSPVIFGDDAAELSEDTDAPSSKMEQKIPKQGRMSVSTLVRSFSESKSVALHSADADDDVFEDYFSPANYQRSKRPLLTNLDVGSDIQIPFELDPVPKKKKLRRSEMSGSATNSIMKRKLEAKQSGNKVNQQSDASSEPQHQESQCVVGESSASVALVAKRRRQSTLPFTSTSTKKSEAVQKRRASTYVASVQSTLTEANTAMEVQKKSVSVLSHMLESRGNEGTVAAGLNEIPSEAEENHNKQDHCLQNMVNKTKAVRTLVMTSMPTEKQHTVVQVVKALGGFSIVDRVCENTTHVVSGGQRRTLNILLGIARGCWILSFEWILWCLEQRQWIPEEPYELSDHFPAAQICRLQRHLSAGEHQQDLFQDQPAIFVSRHSQPPTESLVELIELCGGTVCKTVRQAGICIGKYNGRRPEGNRILSEQWVLDSITHLKKLPYDNYDLEGNC